MRILLCLSALLLAASASARCMSKNMSYWPPPNTTIDAVPVILIEGYGGHQDTVKALKGASLVTLGHRVALTRIGTNVGAFRVTQTVWMPKETLKPGKAYTLVVQGKSKTWRPTAYAADSSKKQRHTYTVAKTPRPALAWTGAPILGDGTRQAFGCGPAINQDVVLPTTREDGLVEVTIARGAQTQTYVLPLPKDGALALGHGMCSGPFVVGGVGEIKATFSLVSGSLTQPGPPQTVTFPAIAGADR